MNESERKPESPLRDTRDDTNQVDIPEHMKPENLEKLRDYGRDMIPPGVA